MMKFFFKLISVSVILCFGLAAMPAKAQGLAAAPRIDPASIEHQFDGAQIPDNVYLSEQMRTVQKAIFNKLLSSPTTVSFFQSWGIDTLELGLDEGLIAKVIFKIWRDVERNPYSTSESDRYLVRDTLKIGFRLGARLVVSGSVAYTRQYSLTYPVATKFKGIVSNNFIINLFLPYQVAKGKLPKKYVLITEDYLEGQGGIRLGATATIPIGIEGRLSVLSLKRNFIDNKDPDRILMFEDRALSTKWAAELYAKLWIIKLPISLVSYEHGRLKRKYIYIEKHTLDQNEEARKALEVAIWENNLILAQKNSKSSFLDDKFNERYSNFTLFGLAYSETFERRDNYVEYTIDNGDNLLAKEKYQVYYGKTRQWYWPTSGEKHFKNIIAAAEFKDGMTVDPLLIFRLRIIDNRTRPKELNQAYLNFIKTVTRDPSFLPPPPTPRGGKKHYGNVDTWLEMDISSENILTLSRIPEATYWHKLALVMKNDNFSNHDWREKVRHHPISKYKERKIIKAQVKLIDALKKFSSLRQSEKANGKLCFKEDNLKSLVDAFKKITFTQRQVVTPVLLGTIVELLGQDQIYIDSRMVFYDYLNDHDFPDLILERKRGPPPSHSNSIHPFIFQDIVQSYHLF